MTAAHTPTPARTNARTKPIEIDLGDTRRSVQSVSDLLKLGRDLVQVTSDRCVAYRDARITLGSLLWQIKAQIDHGELLDFYRRLGVHTRTAQNAMRLASEIGGTGGTIDWARVRDFAEKVRAKYGDTNDRSASTLVETEFGDLTLNQLEELVGVRKPISDSTLGALGIDAMPDDFDPLSAEAMCGDYLDPQERAVDASVGDRELHNSSPVVDHSAAGLSLRAQTASGMPGGAVGDHPPDDPPQNTGRAASRSGPAIGAQLELDYAGVLDAIEQTIDDLRQRVLIGTLTDDDRAAIARLAQTLDLSFSPPTPARDRSRAGDSPEPGRRGIV